MALDLKIRVDTAKGTAEVQAFGRKTKTTFGGAAKAGAKSVKTLEGSVISSVKRMGAAFAGVFAVTRVVGLFKEATVAATEFQFGVAEIKALGIEKSLASVGEEVDALTRAFGQQPQDTIKAYYDAISAGVEESGVKGFLTEASRLALAGATDISTATDLLTSLRNVFTELNDVQIAAFANETKNLGKTTIPELAASLGQVAPTAKAAGASLQEMLAAMVSLTKQGVRTELATTGLRALFSSIVKPSKDAAAAAKRLGLDFSLAGLKAKGLGQFMKELVPAIEGDDKAIISLFGNIRAFNAIAVLAANGGREFTDALSSMDEKALARLEEGVQLMKNTAQFTFSQLQAELGSISREIGERMLPEFVGLAKTVRDFLIENRGQIIRAFVNIGELFSKVGSIFSIFVQGMVGGIAAFVGKAAEGFSKMAEFANLSYQFILDGIRDLVIGASNILNKIPGIDIDVTPVTNALEKFKRKAAESIGPVTGFFKEMGETAMFVADAQFEGIKASAENVFKPFTTEVERSTDAVEELKKVVKGVDEDPPDEGGGLSKTVELLAKVRGEIQKTREQALTLGNAFFETSDAVEQANIGGKILSGLSKFTEAEGGLENMSQNFRAALATTVEQLSTEKQFQLLPKLLGAFSPEEIAPELAEKIIELFGAMDLEELRENLPNITKLLTSEDPKKDAQALSDKLKGIFGATADQTIELAKGVAASFSALSQATGPASDAAKKIGKIQLAVNSAIAISDAASNFAKGSEKTAELNPVQAALFFTAAALNIVASTIALSQMSKIGGAAEGALFQRPTISKFAERGPEVALPLEDERTTEALSEAFSRVGAEGGEPVGSTTHIHIPMGFVGDEEKLGRVISRIVRKTAADKDSVAVPA